MRIPLTKELIPIGLRSLRRERVRLAATRYRPSQRIVTALHVVGLSLLGLLFYNKWLTTTPLSAGDWTWEPAARLQTWWPWPSIWDPSLGFGLKNFQQAYEFPIFAAAGLLAHSGLSWGIIEKLLYFWPLAALSLVAPWVLARLFVGKTAWALLAALIFGANTAVLQVSTVGHAFLAVAVVLAPLVFASFIRAMRSRSLRWALITGLLLGLQSAYEFRITYLTVIACLAYVFLLAVTQPNWKEIGAQATLATATLITFAGCESYWVVPFLTYHGDYGLNLPSSPWIAFMDLTHGLAAVDPFWTWGPPSWFQTVQFNPVFFIVPVAAFLPLLARRVRPEILWLYLVALCSAFLIKQTNPPFGDIYSWMFHHVPGWNMFREASKLYFLVAIAYSILATLWLKGIATLQTRRVIIRRAGAVTSAVATTALVALMVATVTPLATGHLGSTTRPTNEPVSFIALRTLLQRDPEHGSVLWFGAPWVGARPALPDLSVPDGYPLLHMFPPWSETHPIVNLLGRADPLSVFCRDQTIVFCYVDPQMFGYLARQVGATYVVSPAGSEIGFRQPGVSYENLVNNLATALGPPRIIGAQSDGLAVWKLPWSGAPVIQAPAIAAVAGPTGTTTDALPALQALAIPTVYSGYSKDSLTVAGKNVIDVIPPINGSYQVESPGSFYVMAYSLTAKLLLRNGTLKEELPLDFASARLPGWGVYGPLHVDAGQHSLYASTALTVGPLVKWSPIASSILSGRESARSLVTASFDAERIVALGSGAGPSWLELREATDPGWRVANTATRVPSDPLFNLFFVQQSEGSQVFRFSTQGWEGFGVGLAFLWVIAAGLLALRVGRQPLLNSTGERPVQKDRRALINAAHVMAIVGVSLLAIGTTAYILAWVGFQLPLPHATSRLVSPVAASDYGFSEFYLLVAMVALASSCILHLVALGVSELRKE
jgi:hypothetical protein